MALVTPETVLSLSAPTKKFLCPLSANQYGIEFLSFVIQDYETKKTIFEVSRERPLPIDYAAHDPRNPDSLRKINYELSEDFLKLPRIATSLVFSVGDEPLRDFRMIERHYFRDKLIKSYDFDFGFCIPGSKNTWDAVYVMPPLEPSLVDNMIAHPYETSSDSFYFVAGRLVMHNKAYYKYIREDAHAQCKSYEHKYEQKRSAKRQAKQAKEGSSATVYGDDKAEAKSKGSTSTRGGRPAGSKSQSKHEDDDEVVWSKESDYI
ncbi:hypothetical protein CTAYLR_009120 [Chrysophaeum taylorii]|uniref:GMP phosphodiesterase delta subunit domain-containing protein n=1 Tax=Chrysophaeum taylorii TaxID=2483200 RepID=A0AAD7XNH6_9STRA|nr:hypothetical protein CTAYLR_009120 [Chrysophaeum taylorii]